MFLKGYKERKGGYLFLKKSKVVIATQFFSWLQLLRNMPGMQSLKTLLLFDKEQCGFFATTTPALILCQTVDQYSTVCHSGVKISSLQLCWRC